MRNQLTQLASVASYVTLPICAAQGAALRRSVPMLPEAMGDRSGVIDGEGEPFTLLMFGESTAAGVGVESIDESLGAITARGLGEKLNREIHYHIVARNGIRADAAAVELAPLVAGIKFDAICIALGANDVMQMRSTRQWRRDLCNLLEAIWTGTGSSPTILSSVPPFRQFPSLPSPLRDVLGLRSAVFNNIAANIANQHQNLAFIRFNEVAGDAFFSSDGFHPGVNGYRRWAQLFVDAID